MSAAIDFAQWLRATEVVYAFHERVDSGVALEALPLFADDVVLEMRENRMEGIEQVRALLTARQAMTDRHTMHVLGNVRAIAAENGEIMVKLITVVYLKSATAPAGWELEHVFRDTYHLREEGDRLLICRGSDG